ncbi:GNAT family N-acetyltransferase [Clostridium tarantellae]|uniref:GNAT family N-acetyltransferase n=1 Tax=Clostridium tarantellae TaxID=39493 RepID=A0A6I1MHJ8_9CLOT|nr:GNAT family protein [Clostridium tarantellae]MPQ42875.1 GNAT family N-acetyltransferase [Clostridium tarantellae]
MACNKNVCIELVKGSKDEYIIKDLLGIMIGRFFILELDHKNKKSNIRLKFYKEQNYSLLKEILKTLLKVIFKDRDIFKVNIFVSDTLNINSFLDIGFLLEGIISDSIYKNNIYRNELIFGISINDFQENIKISQFEIVGKRIVLKNLTPEYAKDMLDYYIKNEKHLREFEPSRDNSFYTYEGQKSLLIESYKQFIDGSALDLGIFKNNKLIGKIKVSNIVYGSFRSAFIGYSIDKTYEGCGYMSESVKLLCDYVFKEMDLHRLEASTLINNLKSQKVLEKCGFNKLGINKEYLFINGKWRDHLTFYKIK